MKKIIVFALTLTMLLPMLFSCDNKLYVELNGGTLDIAYNEDTPLEDIVASVPTKEGYVFEGWYGDASYMEYIDPKSITEAQRAYNRAYARWIVVPEKKVYEGRLEEIAVTDISRAAQTLDRADISEHYDLTELKHAGYTGFHIKVSIAIRAIDEGYQHIYIYKDRSCLSNPNSVIDFAERYTYGGEEDMEDPSLLYSHRFECKPTDNEDEYTVCEFETTIDISKFSKDIYLRYAASGEGDDTWLSRDVLLTVTPVR